MAIIIPPSHREFSNEQHLQVLKKLVQTLGNRATIWCRPRTSECGPPPDILIHEPGRGFLAIFFDDEELTLQVREDLPCVRSVTSRNTSELARRFARRMLDRLTRFRNRYPGNPETGKRPPSCRAITVFTRVNRSDVPGSWKLGRHALYWDDFVDGRSRRDLRKQVMSQFGGVPNGARASSLQFARWVLLPDIRIPIRRDPCDYSDTCESRFATLDVHQEKLARGLCFGNWLVQGAPGTGKTTLLLHRVRVLAAATDQRKPILVLGPSDPLAAKLANTFSLLGISRVVQTWSLDAWCRHLLVRYRLPLPLHGAGSADELLQRVGRGVSRGQIPVDAYSALFVDDAHEFDRESLTTIMRVAGPNVSCTFLACDGEELACLVKELPPVLGIQMRTAQLRINYRNTSQIYRAALEPMAGNTAHAQRGAARVLRSGPEPTILRARTQTLEAQAIAHALASAKTLGYAWSDMAVLCRDATVLGLCAEAIRQHRLPFENRRRSKDYQPEHDSIKLFTVKASKGLEFPVVAVMGVGKPVGEAEAMDIEEAQLFYAAATRATDKLIVAAGQHSGLAEMLERVVT
jgi:hypothetical protein